MKTKTMLLSMMAGCALFSCQLDEVEIPQEELYLREFIKEYGLFDKNQDWNLAGLKSVTVSGATSDVKVYAKSDETYRLVAHYENVTNGQVLTFDALKDVNDFLVACGGKTIKVKDGGTADFGSASRTYTNTEVENVFTVLEDYKEFTYEEVRAYTNRLPEEKDNRDAVDLISNFSVLQDDRAITVYPIFWNAKFTHMLGIYWYENNERKYQDIYQDKGGDEVQIYANGDWRDAIQNYALEYIDTLDNNKKYYASKIRSKGFTITLPKDTQYGFYIKVLPNGMSNWEQTNYVKTYYSESHENYADGNRVHAAYFREKLSNGETRAYIGFEDKPIIGQVQGDKDLNDFMLIVDPDPTIINEDPDEWIIAAEDLGDTDDFDFNDVVFSVSHAAGQSQAIIKPMAAGGTLKSYILYKEQRIQNDSGAEEIHEMLGGSAPTMMNTITAGPAGEPFDITVDTDFTMAYCDGISNMGNFSIEVHYADSTKSTKILPPGRGDAPQMLCLPHGWKWPYERTSIVTAYPGFGAWGANYADGNTWYYYPEAKTVLGNSSN